jgi:hypothetical protein
MTTQPFSVRNQILLAMQAAFSNIDPNAATTITPFNPTGDPIGITFATVGIGPLELKDTRKANSIGLVAGAEIKRGKFPLWECTWNVAIEFRSAVNSDDLAPGLIAERTLTAVERIVYTDRTWGGLAIDTLDVGNEIDLSNYLDRAVYGVFKLVVNYRHSEGDPRRIVP